MLSKRCGLSYNSWAFGRASVAQRFDSCHWLHSHRPHHGETAAAVRPPTGLRSYFPACYGRYLQLLKRTASHLLVATSDTAAACGPPLCSPSGRFSVPKKRFVAHPDIFTLLEGAKTSGWAAKYFPEPPKTSGWATRCLSGKAASVRNDYEVDYCICFERTGRLQATKCNQKWRVPFG